MHGLSLSIGLSLTALRRSGASAPALVLSASSVAENAAEDTTVGTPSVINGTAAGPITISAQSNANWFKMASGALKVGSASPNYETNASPTVTLTDGTLTRTFTINVTNVLEVTLVDLVFDDSQFPEDAAKTVSITAQAGTTTVLHAGSLPPGMSFDSGDMEIVGTPTTVGSGSATFRTTHPDAAGYHDTVWNWEVTEAGADPIYNAALDPPPVTRTEGVAADDYPIQITVERGTHPPDGYYEFLITSNLARSVVVLNPAPQLIGTLSTVPGMSALDASDGELYIWPRRWNADLTEYGPWPDLPVKWGDVTAATLSSPTGTQTGASTASIGVTSNEAEGRLMWAVLAAASAAPSAADFLASGTGGVATGEDSTPLAGVNTFSVSGLADSTSYKAHFFQEDLAGNASGVVSSATFTTPDITAPTLSSPIDNANGDMAYTGSVSTNESNGTLYWYVSASATPPTAANLKTGSGAVASGNQAVSTGGTQNVSGSGLAASTSYYIHYLHRDAAGNDSAIVSGNGFTTAAAIGPVAWNPSDKSAGITLTNSNHTAEQTSGGSGAFGIRGATGRTSSDGKRYFRVNIDTVPAGGVAVGVADSGQSFSGYPGGGPGATVYYSGGDIYHQGIGPVAAGAYGPGDYIEVFETSSHVYFRKNGSNVGGCDPVAETGGFSRGGSTLYPYLHTQANGQKVTTALGTPASGYTQWEA